MKAPLGQTGAPPGLPKGRRRKEWEFHTFFVTFQKCPFNIAKRALLQNDTQTLPQLIVPFTLQLTALFYFQMFALFCFQLIAPSTLQLITLFCFQLFALFFLGTGLHEWAWFVE